MTKKANENEERSLFDSLGISSKEAFSSSSSSSVLDSNDATSPSTSIHPAVATVLGGAFLLNIGLLLSLPPVLIGRGAPYLPTAQKSMESAFRLIQKHWKKNRHPFHRDHGERNNKILTSLIEKDYDTDYDHLPNFVDLGSGDGRVVFRAAREGIFGRCIGYEINPILHLFALVRRIVQYPLYSKSTEFYCRNLWSINLSSNADIIAVYGLHPMMEDLGKKMKRELKSGSIVISNVFSIPGWKSLDCDGDVWLYEIPHCWEVEEDKEEDGCGENNKSSMTKGN